jgi:hypothetical protein
MKVSGFYTVLAIGIRIVLDPAKVTTINRSLLQTSAKASKTTGLEALDTAFDL